MKTAATMARARRSSFLSAGVHWENWSKRCANHACETSPLRTVFQGKGMRVFDEWICGPDCLESILRDRLADLFTAPRSVDTPRPARVPLGLMLFSRGYMTAEQFRAALEAHRQTGGRVGDIALQLGYVNEEQVAAALAGQWGYPVYSFKNAPTQLPLLVPVHLMELHQMLPVQFLDDTRKLLIGFATRVEFAVLQGIEKMLGCIAAPCFVTSSDLRSRLRAFAEMRRESELIFDQPSHPLEMAHIIKSYSLQASSEAIRFALCRDYLWARLIGPQPQLDLLFRLETRSAPPA